MYHYGHAGGVPRAHNLLTPGESFTSQNNNVIYIYQLSGQRIAFPFFPHISGISSVNDVVFVDKLRQTNEVAESSAKGGIVERFFFFSNCQPLLDFASKPSQTETKRLQKSLDDSSNFTPAINQSRPKDFDGTAVSTVGACI